MSLQINRREKGLIVLVIALILALLGTEHLRKEAVQKAEDLQGLLTYEHQTMDSLKNKFNQTVTEQKAALTNSKEDIKALSAQVFDLKARDERHVKQVNSLVRILQAAHIDTLYIPFSDTVTLKDSSLPANAITVPKHFSDSTALYSLDGSVLKDGVRINSLSIPDTLSLRSVEKKDGLFKPRQTVVQAIHTNPLVKTEGMQSLILKHNTNAWNRWIKPVLAGVAGAFLTYKAVK